MSSMMLPKNLTGIQKAALLILHLGKEKAAPILKQLKEQELEEVMAELARLGDVPAETIDTVLREFRDLAQARAYYARGGIAFAREILESSLGTHKASEILERLEEHSMERPFEFFRGADPRQMLTFLQDEHPQTIALVLANLSSDRAAVIISGLPEELQSEVAKRIATMETTTPEVVRQVAQVLQKKTASLLQPQEVAAVGGVEPLVDILNRADRSTEKTILDHLTETDPELAEEVRNRMFVFEDVTTLDDRSIQLVLREVDSKELAVALKGVGENVKEKIMKNMSERAGQSLAEEIDLLGPVRLKQVEEAQNSVVKAIRRLEEAGQIVISRGGADEFVS